MGRDANLALVGHAMIGLRHALWAPSRGIWPSRTRGCTLNSQRGLGGGGVGERLFSFEQSGKIEVPCSHCEERLFWSTSSDSAVAMERSRGDTSPFSASGLRA